MVAKYDGAMHIDPGIHRLARLGHGGEQLEVLAVGGWRGMTR
jgi:hypothetical protein